MSAKLDGDSRAGLVFGLKNGKIVAVELGG